MAILSESDRTSWVEIQGRKIKLYSMEPASGLQSVNVCDSHNVDGEYEETQYFRSGNHVTAAQANVYGDLQLFKKWLRERAYQQARRM
jgi:hypothetical protein